VRGVATITTGFVVLIAMLAFFAPAALARPIVLKTLEVAATEKPTAEERAEHLPGSPDVQAGSHPFALTTSFSFTEPEEYEENRFRAVGGSLKDGKLELPPGFVGNPNATPKCTYDEFSQDLCPDDTVVGEAVAEIGENVGYIDQHGERIDQLLYGTTAVYNLETPGAVAAEFGFWAAGYAPIFLDASVRTGGDYGITVNARDVPEIIALHGVKVTIWGVPGDPSHNRIRGRCLGLNPINREEAEETGAPYNDERSRREEEEEKGLAPMTPAECPGSLPVQPFLTNPTSCGQPRSATFNVDSWADPGIFVSKTAALPPLLGCEGLDFSPTLTVQPDGSAGSTPTGLNVDLRVPQGATVNPVGLGEADVRDTTVTLPEGVQISPSAADGLQACSEGQIGLHSAEKPSCPDASKIATVHIATPLLEHELTGAVYLAAPQNFAGLPENPFGSLIAMYLVAEEPATGVLIKLAGKVTPDPETGQLTTTFENTPQLPFSELKLEFFGTDRAPLATPALCGTYTTGSSFTPWSAADPANPAEVQHPSSSFEINTGPGGASCSDPLGFSPTLASGTTNINAGSFSNLTTTLSREDGQQSISSVQLHYPAGLSGLLSGVKLCGEAEANAGTCGPGSEIGETIVSVGLGNDPFTVTGGKVYITGPYEGAPFGLSIVNPANAGPFDLQEGRPVVVRAKIEVDPSTAALTITTDPSGEHTIPTIIEGIPLQIKHVNVNITRPGFTFNPTSCNPTEITGTINSAEGASSPVKVPFQVTNCASLKFAPYFSVSTRGKTSKADGASLTAKVSYPSAAQGTYANVARVKVELPLQLPSRLKTLQKACLARVFEANPAACPAESLIGHAVVHTPLLPVPLEGPAIFVSHGGEAFPSLTMVLQGYGVKIDLVGATYISPAGITSTTFKTVPDQPFSSFELVLPEGPYSALAANGSLCKPTTTKTVEKRVKVKVHGHERTVTRKVKQTVASSLIMPNEFVAQNGAVIRQNTTIGVSGCPKTAHKAKAKRHKGKGKK
jgi:hypothetical protein